MCFVCLFFPPSHETYSSSQSIKDKVTVIYVYIYIYCSTNLESFKLIMLQIIPQKSNI